MNTSVPARVSNWIHGKGAKDYHPFQDQVTDEQLELLHEYVKKAYSADGPIDPERGVYMFIRNGYGVKSGVGRVTEDGPQRVTPCVVIDLRKEMFRPDGELDEDYIRFCAQHLNPEIIKLRVNGTIVHELAPPVRKYARHLPSKREMNTHLVYTLADEGLSVYEIMSRLSISKYLVDIILANRPADDAK